MFCSEQVGEEDSRGYRLIQVHLEKWPLNGKSSGTFTTDLYYYCCCCCQVLYNHPSFMELLRVESSPLKENLGVVLLVDGLTSCRANNLRYDTIYLRALKS